MEDKSIIIIGNGESILNTGLGRKIDSFDEVIRINDAFTINHEKDVGEKRTIWSTFNPDKKFNKYIRYLNSLDYSKEEILNSIRDTREIWYVSPVEKYLYPWRYKILGINKKIKRYESLDTLNKIEHIQHHPTTGFILINIVLMMYDKVYTAGFDFNGRKSEVEFSHYFAKFKTDEKAEKPHDLDMELKWVIEKEKEGKILDLKLDMDIIKSKPIDKPTYMICHKCNKKSYYYNWEADICHYCESYI